MTVSQTAACIVSRLADRADVWLTPIIGVKSICYANTKLRLAAYRVLVNIRNRPMAVNLGGEFGNTRFYAISEASAPRGNRAFLARQASDVLYLFRFGDQIAIAMQRTQHTSNRRECGPRIVAARLLWLLLLIGYDDVRQRRATSIACAT